MLLVGKPEWSPLGRPRRISVDNFKMDLGEIVVLTDLSGL
jgi:hypothetical protein